MNSWQGKKVAFLGDSITDAAHVGTTKNYWQYLQESMRIEPLVYAVNGAQWDMIPEQGRRLKAEHPEDADAVIVWMGTNDYNHALPLGEWFSFQEEEANTNGRITLKRRRYFTMTPATFRGRINMGLQYLKKNFPLQQIILITPIHRGFARFSEQNVQPEESFSNDLGLFLDQYVDDLKTAGGLWSVPVIDLYSLAGFFPMMDEYTRYFHDAENDRLHPCAEGHLRIAKTLETALAALPSSFR